MSGGLARRREDTVAVWVAPVIQCDIMFLIICTHLRFLS